MNLSPRVWARADGLSSDDVARLCSPALARASVVSEVWLSLDSASGWVAVGGALTPDAARALSHALGGAVVEVTAHPRGVLLHLLLAGDPFDEVLLIDGDSEAPVDFEHRGVAGAWRAATPKGGPAEGVEAAWRAPGLSALERLSRVARELGVPSTFAAQTVAATPAWPSAVLLVPTARLEVGGAR